MVEIGNSIELHVYRNSGPYFDIQHGKQVAAMKIYHDGSIVVWSSEPAFELGKTAITIKEGENAWDTLARAIAQARKVR